MTSWEERMSAKAKARQAAEEAARDQAAQAADRPVFDAGPPCPDCYEWIHHRIDGADEYCRHECHGDAPLWLPDAGLASTQGMTMDSVEIFDFGPTEQDIINATTCPACQAQPGTRCPDNQYGQPDIHTARVQAFDRCPETGGIVDRQPARCTRPRGHEVVASGHVFYVYWQE